MTITTIGLRNELPGRDDISAMSAPATQARPVTTRDSVGRSSWQTAPWPMTRPSPTPPSSQRASRHFLPLAWAWSNSWKRPHNTPSRSISLVGFLLSGQGFSERASFFIGFSAFSVFVLGYHSYHRELGYRLFLFFQPHHGRILGRISDCIYSTETGGFGFPV